MRGRRLLGRKTVAAGILVIAMITVGLAAMWGRNRQRALPVDIYWRTDVAQSVEGQAENGEYLVQYSGLQGKYFRYESDGNMIDAGPESGGVLVAQKGEEGWDILRYQDGNGERIITGFTAQGAGRVIAYKGGWLYYTVMGEDGQYTYGRKNDQGEIQIYPVSNPSIAYENHGYEPVTCSVSPEGRIAYCIYQVAEEKGLDSFDPNDWEMAVGYHDLADESVALYVAGADGESKRIGWGKYPVWRDAQRLLYVKNGALWQYSLSLDNSAPLLDQYGNTIDIHIDSGNLAVTPDGKYLAYLAYQDSTLLLQPYYTMYREVVLLSLDTGERISAQQVRPRVPYGIQLNRAISP